MTWLPTILAKLLSMLFIPISSIINRSGGPIHTDIVDIDRPSQQEQPCAYQNSQIIDLSLKAELPKFPIVRPKYSHSLPIVRRNSHSLPANDEEFRERAFERIRICPRKDTRPNCKLFDITTIR
ncbi:hypothetical protein FRX31_021011, partial [Thalictrum thalictroides]